MTRKNSSWQAVGNWYDQLVGESGHHYHEKVILPYLKETWQVQAGEAVLDLGCGQGVLARFLGSEVKYVGVDMARNLITAATQADPTPNHQFITADVTRPVGDKIKTVQERLGVTLFDHTACILALQNMAEPAQCIQNLGQLLKVGGDVVLVLNHPCFRIPRQSGWDTNQHTQIHYRWINRYLSPLEIPIKAHPGQKNSPITWSYHFALQDLFGWLKAAGLAVIDLAELTSDKQSEGKMAKAENRSRAEIPLFLVLKAKKIL